MPRTLWKGSIGFGLIYIPVALYPASQEQGLDFDWLDKRDMAPVGYKRVNKVTGKEVSKENIVKRLAYTEGKYAILSEDEIRGNHLKTTQTVELLHFVNVGAVPPEYFEKPYFLAPTAKGEKVYALLRETLRKEKKIGIAYVVIATKQHLAALIPNERALMLFTLRWESEIRGEEGLSFPAAGNAGVKPAEAAMAAQLVNSMSGAWKPGTYRDSFKEDIMALVKKKVAAGKTTEILSVDQVDEAPVSGKILDLTDLLKRSLKKGGGDAAPKPGSNIVTTLKPKRPTTQTKPPAARVKARVAKVKRPVHG
jgi:DNA end-binding protein Ku